MVLSQHYSTLDRVNDPQPEKDKPAELTQFVTEKRMKSEECQRLLLAFMRRHDPSYSVVDAEIDYLADPLAVWQLAKRELFLQSA